MYKKFDEYLSGFFTDDYWYDEGVYFAQGLLEKFNDDDWNELVNSILSKSIEWQSRYVYCIDEGIDNENVVKSLIMLSEVESDDLFINVIDSLRCIMSSENMKFVEINSTLRRRIEELTPQCGISTKKILEDFRVKIHK